jgi:hypothetical protein
MKRIKRIVATVGEYTDREGKTKKQYANIGTLFERDDGSQAIKLESVPIGWNGWASFYELEQKKAELSPQHFEEAPF